MKKGRNLMDQGKKFEFGEERGKLMDALVLRRAFLVEFREKYYVWERDKVRAEGKMCGNGIGIVIGLSTKQVRKEIEMNGGTEFCVSAFA